jgi:hypothetical protein
VIRHQKYSDFSEKSQASQHIRKYDGVDDEDRWNMMMIDMKMMMNKNKMKAMKKSVNDEVMIEKSRDEMKKW